MKSLLTFASFALFAFSATVASPVRAEEKAAPAAVEKKADDASKPAAPTSAHADVKAATGVENRLPTGEATSFKAGTLIYVWSMVTGAKGQQVEHVWKREGKEFRRAKFDIGSPKWSMNSRMPGAAKGNYVVEVVLGEEKLGEVSFVVE
jgi:hypothetical protein